MSQINEDNQRRTPASDLQAVLHELEAAFADVAWQHGEAPDYSTADTALQAIDDIFLETDDSKKYELPRLMSVAIVDTENPLRNRLLCRLIELLDVDFYDPDQTNELLKATKLRIFSGYSDAQSKAIRNWLQHVEARFDLPDCNDLLTSAINHWAQR